MTPEEQERRLASLPTDRRVSYDMHHMRLGAWVWNASWDDETGKRHWLYLGRDADGSIAHKAFAQPTSRPYRMQHLRKRLKRRGALPQEVN